MNEDDLIEGCDVDLDDETTITSDAQAVALVCFGDLPWVGEAADPETGQIVPVLDPDAVELRLRALRELDV